MVLMLASGKSDPSRHATLRWAALLRALVALPIVLGCARAYGADPTVCMPWVAKIVSVQGQVDTRRAGELQWRPVGLEQTICGGDMVRVSGRSRAAILLPENETTVHLDQRTTITIPKTAPAAPGWLELLRGAANFLSRTPISLKIMTPFLNAHIEGTEFLVRVEEDRTSILVFSGTVLAENSAGSVTLQSGEKAVATASQAPTRSLVLHPRDAVVWALYYPPIIDYRSPALTMGAPEIREALRWYRQNDVRAALAKLDEVPDHRRDTRYFDLRAALLLTVGRVDEAQSDIAQALRLARADATAIALRSVIALVKNQKRKALRLARQAVLLAPQSPVPTIALSYAQQASFDIEAALETSEQATQLVPDNGLAWARLAEIELSLGRRDRAVKAAEKAVVLDPMLARTQTVLGFMKLAQIQLKDARTSFEKAMRLDSADPLPRLGLGLAKIRQGDLEEGTEAIEIAATLDPNQSLTRSYLGKAYYEQKRDALARDQFDTAKELDPKDPTPWFYEAIYDQTTNRPVEALQNLQNSIALNDNRAVYRSRLLLDEDLATRNTSLGRIYTDLGFQQLAVVESAKSLSLDPANHSAHRLLSDSYLGLSRHEFARGSELLQSRLLQPITSNPIRPSRSATDIRIAGSPGGPADAGFNEFSPLFERNRVRLLASAFGGNHDTWGEETVLSGLYDRFALSLGQFHSDTEGFRPNNDLKQDIYDVFAQVALTPALDIQTQYRLQERKQGDLRLNFNQSSVRPDRRQRIIEESGRVGLHLRTSPRSDLLVSALYGDIAQRLLFPGTGEILQSQTGYQIDTQYLLHTDRINLTAGGSVFRTEVNRSRQDFVGGLVIPIDLRSFSRDQSTAYIYAHANWPEDLFWTIGSSYDFYNEGNIEISEALNPKVGLQWNATDRLHVRMAYFETLRRAVLINQTLEPTEIAGFNQFYDDRAGAKAKRYGIGFDAHISKSIYGGLELSGRTIRRTDIAFARDEVLQEEESREELYRVYLYSTPADRWAVSADFRLDQFAVTSQRVPGQIRIVLRDTMTLPITVRYFHPSGFFSRLGVTHVRQTIELSEEDPHFDGDDNFVPVEAAVGYRLPKRGGLVTVGVSNLFDEEFRFQGDRFRTLNPFQADSENTGFEPGNVSTVVPDRTLYATITLSF